MHVYIILYYAYVDTSYVRMYTNIMYVVTHIPVQHRLGQHGSVLLDTSQYPNAL